MNPDDNPQNWVPATETDKGTSAIAVSNQDSPSNWVATEGSDNGKTAYDEFKEVKPQQEESTGIPGENVSKVPPRPQEGHPKDNIQDLPAGMGGNTFSYPFDKHLNAVFDSAIGSTWNTFIKPITGKDDKAVDAYLSHLDKEHPLSAIVGGSAPFIATAPLFPEALLPNVYGRLAAQFGTVGFLGALGKARTDDTGKTLGEKSKDVAIETAKQTLAAPIYAKAQVLKILDRPFATALAQSGIITGGVGVMNTFFGDNVAEAFKQSGALGVVNLAFHSPHLIKTVMGRGVASKVSNESGVNINPDGTDEEIRTQINKASDVIAKNMKGIDKPHIISAVVKGNGFESQGASHEDALEKLGMSKDMVTEGKDYQTGYNVQNPDGTIDFITREQSKRPPFNLPTGHSSEVPGLNQSKFMIPPDLKIVNPETLENISGAYVHNDPLDISFGKNDKLTSKKIRQEFSGVKNSQIVRGNQLADKIKELVPDKEERQALFWYKAAEGNTDFRQELAPISRHAG